MLSLGRVGLLLLHSSAFEGLTAARLARAFIHGLRFDLSLTLTLVGLPLWLMMLPARWAARPVWHAAWGWLAYAALVIIAFLVIGDLLYFGTVGRHVGSELAVALETERAALVRMALDEPLALGLFALIATGLAFTWRRLPGPDPTPRAAPAAAAWAAWVLIVPLVVIGIRGGVQHKPINIVNAFQYGSVTEGNLTLNAPFTAYHATRNTHDSKNLRVLPADEAVDIVRSRFATDEWPSDRYPLERYAAPGAGEPIPRSERNVVVLVLESWDALLVDSIRSREGLAPLGITPVFDSLVSEGRLYTRFYASGQRSIEGIAALIASVPTLPGKPYLGRGMEQSRLSYLGDLARDNGYHAVFVRSAKRGSYRLDAVAALAGFDEYAGAEDILEIPSHTAAESGPWGAWDFDSLRHLDRLLRDSPRPFVGFFFGSSTHQPFSTPDEVFDVRPTDGDENRFLNTVHYVDWALGQYLELARRSGYRDDTLFLITADQTGPFVEASAPVARHRIPALLIGPGIEPGTVAEEIASQMDVVPTIADYLGWESRHASFGESMLSEREPAALLKHGELMLRLGSDGWIAHDLARRLDGEGSEAAQARLERSLLAEVQVVMDLLSKNRIFSGDYGRMRTSSGSTPGNSP